MIKVNDCICHYVYETGYGKIIFMRCFLNHHKHFHYTRFSIFPFYLQRLYTLTHRVHQLEKTCYKTKRHIPKEQEIIMWQSCHRYLAKVLFCFHFFNAFLSQRNCYHVAIVRVYTSIWKGKKGYQISG